MKYNFDELTDRSGTNSLKWDVSDSELPMWVADMDFKTAPQITEALEKRARHGIFGYSVIPPEWYSAYIGWWKRRYGFEIKKEWLIFSTGVIPVISSVVRKLTTPAENVVVFTPVYNIFFNSIVNNGRNVLECPLKYDGGEYFIDFDDLERKLKNPQTTMLIFCNPHNPVGKIWDRETIKKVGSLCKKHGVIAVSDEIHCDLTAVGKSYTPFASVSDECAQNCIMCVAPTKTFNIAGLQTAAAVVPNEFLRNKVNRALNTDEVAEPNCFATAAAIAAYDGGGQWLDELRQYLDENREIVHTALKSVKAFKSDATYLMWLDCSEICENSRELARFIRRETGLYLSDGAQYGTGGEKFLRLNIACPKERLADGIKRLETGTERYKNAVTQKA